MTSQLKPERSIKYAKEEIVKRVGSEAAYAAVWWVGKRAE